MRALLLSVSLMGVLATPAAAQSMRADVFLQKAQALKAKGPLALLSGDMKKLQGEMRGSAEQLRAERLAATKAGQKPAYCPPEKAGGLKVSEILGHFQSIPAAERSRINTKEAFKRLLVKKYPCRA
jgi:hypothetical protein